MKQQCKRGHNRTPENVGPRGSCLSCKRLLSRARYQQNKVTVDNKNREWRKKNPGRLRELSRETGWRQNGILNMSWPRFIKLLDAQSWRCGICEKRIDESASVDHDHATGEVRGLLCQNCNAVLGLAGDSVKVLRAAADFLEAWNGDNYRTEG